MISVFRYFSKRAFLPGLVGLIYLFIYLPIFVLILFSFNAGDFAAGWQGFSLHWYRTMFATPEILNALKSSLIIALSATSLSLLLGISVVIASRWLSLSRFLPVFYLSVMVPDMLLGIGLLCLFSTFSFPLGYKSLIIGHTVIGLGFVVPIVGTRFAQLDPILTEASLDLGATQWQTIRFVVFPLLLPAIIASGLLVFTLSLDDFVISFFCSGSQITTLSVYVYQQVRDMVDPTINALSTCMLALSALGILALSFGNLLDEVVGHE